MLGQISIALFSFLSPGGLESSLWLHFSDFFLFLLSLSPHIWTKTQFGLFIDTFEAMGGKGSRAERANPFSRSCVIPHIFLEMKRRHWADVCCLCLYRERRCSPWINTCLKRKMSDLPRTSAGERETEIVKWRFWRKWQALNSAWGCCNRRTQPAFDFC